MLKRRVTALFYALALALVVPAELNAECWYGLTVRGTDGINYCEPFIGADCVYCEVVEKG